VEDTKYFESFENGAELVSVYVKLLSEKKSVDVAIIDLNMPIMDGSKAPMTLRTLEAQKDISNVPIFFSQESKQTKTSKGSWKNLTLPSI
jgi:CheY-like chemotaxis protein